MNSVNNISRQAFRAKVTQLAFRDISQQYAQPRRARRKMARAIGKQAFKAWRNGEASNNS